MSKPISRREWELEDLAHLDDAIDEYKMDTGLLALPGLESMRDQVAIRLGVPTRFENHDDPDPVLDYR